MASKDDFSVTPKCNRDSCISIQTSFFGNESYRRSLDASCDNTRTGRAAGRYTRWAYPYNSKLGGMEIRHTSSIGQPKIVPVKHGMTSSVDAYHLSLESGNMRMIPIAGINLSLPVIGWVDWTVDLPPPGVPITADLIHALLEMLSIEFSRHLLSQTWKKTRSILMV